MKNGYAAINKTQNDKKYPVVIKIIHLDVSQTYSTVEVSRSLATTNTTIPIDQVQHKLPAVPPFGACQTPAQ